jgi:16S rRNA (guanine527-N7)-methyltransferase
VGSGASWWFRTDLPEDQPPERWPVTESERLLLHEWSSAAFGVGLDAEAASRIGRFLDLLTTWNRRLRLTGERDRSTLIRKHVADAMACVPWLPRSGSFLDVGTGAGFPGVILACIRPDSPAVLLDSRQRPTSFLNEVIRTLPLTHARVVTMRAEEAAFDPTLAGRQSLVTSRATRMDDVFRLARPLIADGGRVISMQTPRTDRSTAETCARRHGYEAVELCDYRLPDGEPRRLIVAR